MEDETPQETPTPVPQNARKRAITRIPRDRRYVRKYPRDRLAANGIEPRKPLKNRKRGRPRRPGPARKYRDAPFRLSPAYRKNARFHTITVPEAAYLMLNELSQFYKKSKSQLILELVKPAFDKAYEESLTLARIAANKEKAHATTKAPDNDQPPRRTHF